MLLSLTDHFCDADKVFVFLVLLQEVFNSKHTVDVIMSTSSTSLTSC